MQFVYNIFLAMLVCAGYHGKGSAFWWVFAWDLGVHLLQILIRSSRAYFVGYHSQCSWLVWFGWLMYCLQSNELLSPLLFFNLQLLSPSTLLHLFCDDTKHWPAVFYLGFGKMVESATGSAVGSSVAFVEGVQPWLIAPGCMSQFFL